MQRTALFLALIIIVLSGCATLKHFDAKSEYDRGLQLFNQSKYEEASRHFVKATEIDPEFAEAYLYLGRCYLNMGRWVDALQPLRMAYNLAPQKTKKEALNLLFDALFGSARTMFEQGNYQASVDYLKESLLLDPQSGEATLQLGQALIALGGQMLADGKVEEAIQAYFEGLEYTPGNIEAYIMLAKALFADGRIREALEAVGKASSMDSNNSEAGWLYQELLKQ